jgi:hypothetical protein
VIGKAVHVRAGFFGLWVAIHAVYGFGAVADDVLTGDGFEAHAAELIVAPMPEGFVCPGEALGGKKFVEENGAVNGSVLAFAAARWEHGAGGGIGLREIHEELVNAVGHGDRAGAFGFGQGDAEEAIGQVDVLPAEGEDFAPSHSAQGTENAEGLEVRFVALQEIEEADNFGRGGNGGFDVFPLWGDNRFAGIGGYPVLPMGPCEKGGDGFQIVPGSVAAVGLQAMIPKGADVVAGNGSKWDLLRAEMVLQESQEHLDSGLVGNVRAGAQTYPAIIEPIGGSGFEIDGGNGNGFGFALEFQGFEFRNLSLCPGKIGLSRDGRGQGLADVLAHAVEVRIPFSLFWTPYDAGHGSFSRGFSLPHDAPSSALLARDESGNRNHLRNHCGLEKEKPLLSQGFLNWWPGSESNQRHIRNKSVCSFTRYFAVDGYVRRWFDVVFATIIATTFRGFRGVADSDPEKISCSCAHPPRLESLRVARARGAKKGQKKAEKWSFFACFSGVLPEGGRLAGFFT